MEWTSHWGANIICVTHCVKLFATMHLYGYKNVVPKQQQCDPNSNVCTIILYRFVVPPHQCVWYCGQSNTQLRLQPQPDHTSPLLPAPLPSLASLVTNECLYKAAGRLGHMPPCSPTMWNYTAHCTGMICTLQLSLGGSARSKPPPTQCARQSLPLKRGFLGWDTSQVWNQTPLRCPFQ